MIRLFFCLLLSLGYAEEMCLGIGHPAIDLLFPVEESFFHELEIQERGGSLLYDEEQLLHLLSKAPHRPHLAPGGSVPNTLRALALLGGGAAYFSHMGTDPASDFFCRSLEEAGVEGRFVRGEHYSPAQIAILISPDGERTFIVVEKEPPMGILDPSHFSGATALYTEARHMRYGRMLEEALEFAKRAQIPIALGLSSFEVVRQDRPRLLPLLATYVDLLFGNEEEVRALTGKEPLEGVFEIPCPLVVMTRGSKGCLIVERGVPLEVPPFPIDQLVDTTGAGDHFAAGFLYGYFRGWPLYSCALLGNRLGASAVQVLGAHLPSAVWEEVRKYAEEMEAVLF